MKGLTISIACFNGGRFLEECWNSVRSKLSEDQEILIVDDASTDGATSDILSRLENSDDRTRVVRHSDNKGLAETRNTGLANAAYDYILPIDCDDLLAEDWHEFAHKAINDLNGDDEIAFVHCATEMFEGAAGLTSSCYPLTEQLVAQKHHVPSWIIYRTSEGLNAGGYNTAILKWTDWSFGAALLNHRLKSQKTNKIRYYPHPYYRYRIHDNVDRVSQRVVSEKSMIIITVKNNIELFNKYYEGGVHNISAEVLDSKPGLLDCIMHIAQEDLGIARQFAKDRQLNVVSPLSRWRAP